jgi:hypothetical protein
VPNSTLGRLYKGVTKQWVVQEDGHSKKRELPHHLHHHNHHRTGMDSIRVQIPFRMMFYTAAVFLVLPLTLFIWKELAIANNGVLGEETHQKTVPFVLKHQPTWMDDLPKESAVPREKKSRPSDSSDDSDSAPTRKESAHEKSAGMTTDTQITPLVKQVENQNASLHNEQDEGKKLLLSPPPPPPLEDSSATNNSPLSMDSKERPGLDEPGDSATTGANERDPILVEAVPITGAKAGLEEVSTAEQVAVAHGEHNNEEKKMELVEFVAVPDLKEPEDHD